MANTTLFEKKEVKLTKDQAIKRLKRAWNAGKDEKIMEIKKQYSGDFEDVFRKAFGETGIETYGFDVVNNLTEGNIWMGVNTNNYQKDLDRFHIFAVVLYMIDAGEFLPESILDERLMAKINLACDALGYDDIYELEKNEKGKFIVDTTKKCVNPKGIEVDKIKNDEIRELYQAQLDDIADYKNKVGSYDYQKLIDAMEADDNQLEEEIEYRAGTPNWMVDMYNKGVRERNEKKLKGEADEDDEEEVEDKKSKKKDTKAKKNPKEKDDTDFVVKKNKKGEDKEENEDENATVKKDPRAPKKEEPKQEVAVVNHTPVQPTQQVFYGYNPVTQEPAHMGPMPTIQPAPAAPENPTDDEVDIDDIFAGLFSEEQQDTLEKAFENMGEDKAKKLLSSDDFKNQFQTLINMVVNASASEQKEGAKSSKKNPRAKK